jgi:hypothetical protein
MPYSVESRNSRIDAGRNVVVFVFAVPHAESEYALNMIDASKIASLLDNTQYDALLLRYKDWNDPSIRSIWKDVGHTKNPIIVLYSSNQAPQAYDAITLMPIANEISIRNERGNDD